MEIKLTKESAARMIKTCDALLASEPHSKNDKSLRELDAWIGVNIFGKKAIHKNGPRPTKGTEDDYFVIEYIHISHSLPHYTTDQAAAMQVLKACLKSSRPHGGIVIYDSQISQVPCFTVEAQAIGNLRVQAETLPLAIALFAKKLFSK